LAATRTGCSRFLVIARRSLNEVQDALRGARLKSYIEVDDLAPIHALLRRIYPALSRLIARLRVRSDASSKRTPGLR
jgi:hypothetical protein